MTIHVISTGNNIEQGHAVVSADMLGNYDSVSVNVAPTGLGGLSDYSTLQYKFSDDEHVEHALIDVSTSDSGVVSAVAGKSIEVMSYTFLATAASTVTFKSDTTPISSGMTVDANGGAAVASTTPLMTTNPGEALNITTSAGSVNGHLSYRVK